MNWDEIFRNGIPTLKELEKQREQKNDTGRSPTTN